MNCRSSRGRSTSSATRKGYRGTVMLQMKIVHLNDVPIGQASTWREVYALLRQQRLEFIGKPGAAEGPTAFYVLTKPADLKGSRLVKSGERH